MRLSSVTLLLLLSGFFSGCASTGPRTDTSSGEYDVFLENTDGESVRPAVADKKAPVAPPAAHEKAQAAMANGDMDTALFFFVKAIEADPKDEKALNGIARIHGKRGNYDLVILANRMILGISPENVDALESLGLELTRKGDRTEAKAWLLRTITIDPTRPRAFNGLGIIADHDKEFGAANMYYNFSLELDPESPRTLNNYGYSRYLAGDRAGAEQLYRRAFEKDQDFAQARLNLGLLYATQGDLTQAQAEFERVLTKPQAYNELGYILMTERNLEQAEQLFQKAISASPTFFLQANENLERVRALRALKGKPAPTTEKAATTASKRTNAPESK